MRGELRRTALAATAAIAALAGSLTFTSPASAGTNGQQIAFYDAEHIANSVRVSGANESGKIVSHCWNTPYTSNYFTGWWWKGETSVNWYSKTGCPTNAFIMGVGPYVPKVQNDDWFWVSDGGL